MKRKYLIPTQPVFQGPDIIPLVEDNIEDDHDADHDIEGDKSCHWWELAIVMDNHEDEEDYNFRENIHQYFQYKNDNVLLSQRFIFALITIKK